MAVAEDGRIRNTSLKDRLLQSNDGRRLLTDLDAWLSHQPEPERTELMTALDGRDEDFYGAELELYLGKVFAERGWPFERHPRIEGSEKQPDYLVDAIAGGLFVEARASVDLGVLARDEVMRQLRDSLDAVTGREWVHTTIEGAFPGDFSVPRASEAMTAAVDRLRDGEAAGEIVAYQEGGCSIAVEVLTTDRERDGSVFCGWQFGSTAHDADTADALAKAVLRKASRYGDLGKPYVVAVFAQRDFPISRHGVTSALYGTRKWKLSVPADPSQSVEFLGEEYSRDGVFTAVADGEPIRTRVSAVAIYDRANRLDGEGLQYELVILHNPFAAHPLDLEAFDGVPQFVTSADSDEDIVRMAWDRDPPRWWD